MKNKKIKPEVWYQSQEVYYWCHISKTPRFICRDTKTLDIYKKRI